MDCPYVLAGGVAVIYYGAPRFTHDLDFLVSRLNESKAKELLTRLKGEGFSFNERKARKLFTRGGIFRMEGIRDFVEGFTVDVIVHPRIKNLLKRSRSIEGTNIRIISPEDLIVQKLMLIDKSMPEKPRPQNSADVLTLLVAQWNKMDVRYLRAEAVEHDVNDLLEKFLKRVPKQMR